MLIYLDIFGLRVPTYGLCMLLGLGVGLLVFFLNQRRSQTNRYDAAFFAIWAGIGSVVGAKLLYLIVELPAWTARPELFWAYLGGWVFYGGAIGGALAGGLCARHYRMDVRDAFDMAAPALAIGQGIGRVGCFLVGCCHGCPYDGPLAVTYPHGPFAPAGVPLLPVQLMESAFLAVLFIVLMVVYRRAKQKGRTTACYFLGYGVWRFVIEFFRADPRGSVGALSTSQFISIFVVALGVLMLVQPRWLVALLAPKREKEEEHGTD